MPSAENTMRAEIVAYMIYLEVPEYPVNGEIVL